MTNETEEPKPQAPAQPVGQMLKKRRTGLRLSLADVELATKIRGKFLVRLEAGDYKHLPNDIYTRGFVQNYADFLGLDPEAVVKTYLEERGGRVEDATPAKANPVRTRALVVTPRLLIAGATLLVVGVIVAYLSWQLNALAAAPSLEVYQPAPDQIVSGSVLDAAGRAGGGADVFINDSPVLTDVNGNFSDKVALQDGLNTITITARNQFGKSTTETRTVLARLPEVRRGEKALPAKKFDGVGVEVAVRGAATWIAVEIDGREEFRRTMQDGTSEVFRGKSSIKISSGNAGVTSVKVTNKVVERHEINPLGAGGEVIRDLDFSKDTVLE